MHTQRYSRQCNALQNPNRMSVLSDDVHQLSGRWRHSCCSLRRRVITSHTSEVSLGPFPLDWLASTPVSRDAVVYNWHEAKTYCVQLAILCREHCTAVCYSPSVSNSLQSAYSWQRRYNPNIRWCRVRDERSTPSHLCDDLSRQNLVALHQTVLAYLLGIENWPLPVCASAQNIIKPFILVAYGAEPENSKPQHTDRQTPIALSSSLSA